MELTCSNTGNQHEPWGRFHMNGFQGRMSAHTYQSSWQMSTSGVPVHPASLAKHPQRWSKEEVGVWLKWCSEEYSIETIPQDKFDMNGKAVCLLSRSDFMERLPKNGDLLYNCLQNLISKSVGGGGVVCPQLQARPSVPPGMSMTYADHPLQPIKSEAMPTGLLLISGAQTQTTQSSPLPGSHFRNRPYVPIQPHPLLVPKEEGQQQASVSPNITAARSPASSINSEVDQDSVSSDEHEELPEDQEQTTDFPKQESKLAGAGFTVGQVMRRRGSADCRLLWEFIYLLLQNSEYSNCVCWETKEEYVFRILNPTALAELWGQQKNRTNMTYEKLSRALRYYYRMNIIKKVPGKRLTYKFLQPPMNIQKGQRGARPHSKLNNNNNNNNNSNSSGSNTNNSSNENSPVSTKHEASPTDGHPIICKLENESPPVTSENMEVTSDSMGMASSPVPKIRIPVPIMGNAFVPHCSMTTGPTEHMLYVNGHVIENLHRRHAHEGMYDQTMMPVRSIKADRHFDELNSADASKLSLINRLSPETAKIAHASNRFTSAEHEQISNNIQPAHAPRVNHVLRLPIDSHYFHTNDVQHRIHPTHHRPSQARSVSPRSDYPDEPEDLSVRKPTSGSPTSDLWSEGHGQGQNNMYKPLYRRASLDS